MRAEKEKHRKNAKRIASIAAIVTLVISVIVKLFLNELDLQVIVASPVAVFASVLTYLYWRYDQTWAKKNRNRSLEGIWGYWVHDEKARQTKVGYFRAEHDDFGIEVIEGETRLIENDKPQRRARHYWKAELCGFDERRVLLLFESTAGESDTAGELTKGAKYEWIWKLEREAPLDQPPHKLTGRFTDPRADRFEHRGSVVAWRITKQDIDAIETKGDDWKHEVINLAYENCRQELKDRGYLASA